MNAGPNLGQKGIGKQVIPVGTRRKRSELSGGVTNKKPSKVEAFEGSIFCVTSLKFVEI